MSQSWKNYGRAWIIISCGCWWRANTLSTYEFMCFMFLSVYVCVCLCVYACVFVYARVCDWRRMYMCLDAKIFTCSIFKLLINRFLHFDQTSIICWLPRAYLAHVAHNLCIQNIGCEKREEDHFIPSSKITFLIYKTHLFYRALSFQCN